MQRLYAVRPDFGSMTVEYKELGSPHLWWLPIPVFCRIHDIDYKQFCKLYI